VTGDHGVVGAGCEGQSGGVGDDQRKGLHSPGVVDQAIEHRRRDVDADEVNTSLVQRERHPAGADADLQHSAAAGELSRQHIDHLTGLLRRQRPRLVVVAGGAVKRDAHSRTLNWAPVTNLPDDR